MNDKKLILFDLDGTLAVSKATMDTEMSELLSDLLKIKKVGVMSGGSYEQFQKQFLSSLSAEPTDLESLYLFPTCAGAMYKYDKNKGWQNVYQEKFSEGEKSVIFTAFERALMAIDFEHPSNIFGDQIDDRDNQITFSACGQSAPIDVKTAWDPDHKKRLAIKRALDPLLPDFEIRIGGTTSVDITRKGVDKAYGIRQVEKKLKIAKNEMLFIGDALYEGGNDYVVKSEGVETIAVRGPNETKKVIRDIIKQSK